MYENMTYDTILDRMMARVLEGNPNLDTRNASIIHSALAPAAVELVNLYIEADAVLDESFADTAGRDFLIRRCAERGIVPEAATAAVWSAVLDADVPIGARFSAGKLNFVVTEWISEGTWKLLCETPGNVGNSPEVTLIPIDYVPGLTRALLSELLIPGEDEEDTEHLRRRYFNSFDTQAFGGNVADYTEKVNAIQGVGGCKVARTPSGGGTVGVTVISSIYDVPSTALVEAVQTALDPTQNHGEGLGLAPIGHTVTVRGVRAAAVDIESQITYDSGYVWEDVKPYAEAAIDAYFKELAEEWADTGAMVVRISQIETRLLSVTGIVDIAHTSLCGKEENRTLAADEIPVRGVLQEGGAENPAAFSAREPSPEEPLLRGQADG